jgi:pyrophosphate--fructose-6-phosphate 1-phosphotransferase
VTFGFDTATKVYSNLIGNICKDALSSKKYYHFIRLMGRSASHITLECSLQTRPNVTLISEERKPFSQILNEIEKVILNRKALGKEYGVILIPEGLLEFAPDINLQPNPCVQNNNIKLPFDLSLVGYDSHGNIALSEIETERVISSELKKRSSIKVVNHYFGYEGRGAAPSLFDSIYAYHLGVMAGFGSVQGLHSVLCAIGNVTSSINEWNFKYLNLPSLIKTEIRKNKPVPVIEKALVDINKSPYVYFLGQKEEWMYNDKYLFPGPIDIRESPERLSLPFSLTFRNGRVNE